MTETAGPDKVATADQIGLSAREAAAPPPDPPPRDAASWARKVDRLEVDHRSGVRGTNVAGRRLTGPVQGFGKMWQKTYRMDAGPQITPEQAIATWREHFPEFWPKGNRFAGALTGINPGDVALLDLAIGGGVKLSTGVFVLYADPESFTLMTALGNRRGLPDAKVDMKTTCVDSKRQWRHANNIWHNSMIRSVLQTLTFRRNKKPT